MAVDLENLNFEYGDVVYHFKGLFMRKILMMFLYWTTGVLRTESRRKLKKGIYGKNFLKRGF